ncbi:MAG: hypothetical protein WBN50_11795 [Lutimonas sp.]
MRYYLVIISFLIVIVACNNDGGEVREYERSIVPYQKGIVLKKFLNRGGLAEITIVNIKEEKESLWIYGDYDAYEEIRKGDSIIKYANSNKLLLIRKDSVVKLSNYSWDRLKTLYTYDTWKVGELNNWMLKE